MTTISLRTLALSTALAFPPVAALAADAVVPDPNYPGGRATAHAVIVAAEQLLGLEIDTITTTAVPVIWEGMNRGDGQIDVWTEVWLPNQQPMVDKFVEEEGSVILTEHSFEAIQGYCMTAKDAKAHGISSVYDLASPEAAALFDANENGMGELWIGPAGWLSTNIERVRARDYGLDQFFELESFDEAVATANLDRAVKEGRPWLGYCYGPHQNFVLYDLVLLEEPAHDPERFVMVQPSDDPAWFEKSNVETAYAETRVHRAYSASLAERQPGLVDLIEGMRITADDVNAWAHEIAVEGKEPRAVLEAWYAENEDRAIDWVQ